MLLKTRKKIDFLNPKTEAEIKEKWFSVYNYISLKELVLTARKDFLEILSKINVFLLIISIILWIIKISFVFYFLAFSYFIIFFIIFIKLIKRTYYFLLISDVVYSDKWVILADKFFWFYDEKIKKYLLKYEKIFLEYLWKDSFLEEVIEKKRREILGSTTDIGSGFINDVLKNSNSFDRESAWTLFLWIIVFFIYVFSLYLFFYLSYFFWLIFSVIYSFFIKIILFFKDKIELKIKNKTIKIDERLKKMKKIYILLQNKINDFKDWKISDISNFIEKNFNDFYTQISLVLKEKNNLEKIINSSKYKDFIDFWIFKKYLKNNFNAPIKDMINLLEKYKKLLEKQITELQKLNKHSKNQKLDINNTEILDKNLEQKEFILEKKLNILKNNLEYLKKSLL